MQDIKATSAEALTHESKSALINVVGKKAALKLIDSFKTIHSIARASPQEIRNNIPTISDRKIKDLRHSFRLARALQSEVIPKKYEINSSKDIANLLREDFRLLTNEVLKLVMINIRNEVIKVADINQGSVDSFQSDLRSIFNPAVSYNAFTIALAHNHPSGNILPSQKDIEMTRQVASAGGILNIQLVDHIVMGSLNTQQEKDWFSIKSLGVF